MKKPKRLASAVSAFVFLACTGELWGQEFRSNELSADIVRVLSKDLFDINSVPYLQPMVEAFNATSNAGFYHSAYVSAQDTFYVRIGLRGMGGFVREDQRLYQPGIPTGETENSVASPLAILVANRVKAIRRPLRHRAPAPLHPADPARHDGRTLHVLGCRTEAFDFAVPAGVGSARPCRSVRLPADESVEPGRRYCGRARCRCGDHERERACELRSRPVHLLRWTGAGVDRY